MKKALVSVACVAVALIIAAQFATIFVIQLIGAIPEGRTILISRLMKLNFIDSPDALCE